MRPVQVRRVLGKGNHLLLAFVPELEVEGLEALLHSQRLSDMDSGHLVVTLGQTVIGNSGVEMVDMVVPDVRGKPPQNTG